MADDCFDRAAIRAAMKSADVRAGELAAAIGKDPSRLSAYLTGRTGIGWSVGCAIASALGVPVEALYKYQARSGPVLDPAEVELVELFRALSPIDRGRALERLAMLAGSSGESIEARAARAAAAARANVRSGPKGPAAGQGSEPRGGA